MPIQLPQAPSPDPADTYAQRHTTWWQQCDVIIRSAAVAASEAHAKAQSDTAVAMQANVAMQRQIFEAPPDPPCKPTKAQLVYALIADHPQASILTNSNIVDGCTKIVEAYLSKYPDAVQV